MPRTAVNLILILLHLLLLLIGVTNADTPEDNPYDFSFENNIQSPNVIQADTTTNITVYVDNNKHFGVFDAYRLYLAIDPIYQNGSELDATQDGTGWDIGACYLVNSTSFTTHNTSVKIPASVGVGGVDLRYAIVAIPFNQSVSSPANSVEGIAYGDTFSLSGGTAEWSQWELDGMAIGFPLQIAQDYLPCDEYDCARRCYAKYYPANLNLADNCGLKLSYECAAACPDTTFPAFEEAINGWWNLASRPPQDLPASCNATAYMTVKTSSANVAMTWKDVLGLVGLVGALMLTFTIM